ncbi:hypothetical protein E1301_Tti006885 [Triplophysa tibetana]|uniref:Uncharacterized protein n=1 Tax=Triplophysa tibetana TaxID=1572043 RepID=A0A5A9N277_9TELE|nr:hypothetical protein E1301_Tti006885 [Triplophysa tibetana]
MSVSSGYKLAQDLRVFCAVRPPGLTSFQSCTLRLSKTARFAYSVTLARLPSSLPHTCPSAENISVASSFLQAFELSSCFRLGCVRARCPDIIVKFALHSSAADEELLRTDIMRWGDGASVVQSCVGVRLSLHLSHFREHARVTGFCGGTSSSSTLQESLCCKTRDPHPHSVQQGDECLARLALTVAFAVACMMDEGHQNSGVTRCASHNLEFRTYSLSICCSDLLKGVRCQQFGKL